MDQVLGKFLFISKQDYISHVRIQDFASFENYFVVIQECA